MMFSRHVTKDISAYCQGELSVEASRQFAEHIIACAKCRREFEEIKSGIRLAEELPLVAAPETLWTRVEASVGSVSTRERAAPVNRWWSTRVAAVAAVLLVVGGLGVWWFGGRGFKNDLRRASWEVQRL